MTAVWWSRALLASSLAAAGVLGCEAARPQLRVRQPEPISRSTQASYVPGELLVKLVPGAGEQLEAALAARRAPTDTGLDWFDRLNERYGVTQIEPVFTRQPDSEDLKRKFPERSRRAPPGADPPSLKYIYKLILSPPAPILHAAADYAAHPAVEYAEPNYLATIQ